jgi:hypothetical protein
MMVVPAAGGPVRNLIAYDHGTEHPIAPMPQLLGKSQGGGKHLASRMTFCVSGIVIDVDAICGTGIGKSRSFCKRPAAVHQES